jgi:DNA-binding CsgD family transcriptional regulator/tetratricopeptide (TPR) repeat protein
MAGRSSAGTAGLIGREAEQAAFEDFLGPGAVAQVLVLVGGQGVGKTALWEAGLRRARERDFRVLAARPSAAEVQHSFAGLFDLLEGIAAAALGELPPPQLRALEAALLRSEPPAEAPEPFAVAAGFLGALRCLAAAGPLLIAVDDLQWLDAASAGVLAFAARRFHGPRCRFLFARRSGRPGEVEQALGPAGVTRLDVRPLSVSDTLRLLARRLGLTLPRRTLDQLFEVTHGIPLLVLELGRTLAAQGTPAFGADLPLADLADNPFGERVASLAGPARRALQAAALSGNASPGMLEAVVSPAVVADLVADGLLIIDGPRVRISHPLLGVAARKQSSAQERRALHFDLAALADDETVRARHLALASRGRNPRLGSIIASAAAAALRRGAVRDAVDLAEHALRLTPRDAAEFPDRLLELAEYLEMAGEPPRVRELLEPRIGDLPAGRARPRAHLLLGEASDLAEQERLLELVLAESETEPALRATALATKSILLSIVRVERTCEALACAQQAVALARSADSPVEQHALQALAWARVLRGLPVDDLREQFPVLPECSGLYESSIDRPAGVRLAFRGQIAAARTVFHRLQALADERGDGRFRAIVQLQQCELELRAGDVRECERLLDHWDERAALEDLASTRARCQALMAAIRGLPQETERWAAAAMAAVAASASDPADLRWDQLEARRASGVAALLAHQPERAARDLGAIWEHTRQQGIADPGAFPVAPDLVEALVRLGRTDEAAAVTGWLRGQAERQQHPWGLATADRCAAAVALTSQYDEAQAARLAAAAASLGELGLGFDRARSLLWLGQVARRARKRATARGCLEAAAVAFDALGSDGWASEARAGLARPGTGGAARAGQLTAAEQRVADLAAEGLSNKEIARHLFVTVHTVEVHLGRVYAKLNVRSRVHLASHLATSAREHRKD